VLKYKFAEEINDQELIAEFKADFDTYSAQYQN